MIALAAQRHDLTTLPLEAGVRDRQHHRRRGGPVPRHRPPRAPQPRPRPAKRPPAEGNDPMRHHAIEILTLLADRRPWC